MDYETMLDTVVMNAWEIWTQNGLDMDNDDRIQTEKHVYDVASNSYYDDISLQEWIDETLRKLEGK